MINRTVTEQRNRDNCMYSTLCYRGNGICDKCVRVAIWISALQLPGLPTSGKRLGPGEPCFLHLLQYFNKTQVTLASSIIGGRIGEFDQKGSVRVRFHQKLPCPGCLVRTFLCLCPVPLPSSRRYTIPLPHILALSPLLTLIQVSKSPLALKMNHFLKFGFAISEFVQITSPLKMWFLSRHLIIVYTWIYLSCIIC